MPSDRDDERCSGHRVGEQAAGDSEVLLDHLGREHLGRFSLDERTALPHRDEVVGIPSGQVEVVQHHHHGRAGRPVEVGDQVQDLDGMGDVEEGRRLVQQQQVGLLSQHHGDPDPLPLPAGQLLHPPAGQVRGLGDVQGSRYGLVVAASPLPEQPGVRVPTQPDQLGDGDPLRRDGRLREQAQGARHLLGRHPVDVPTVEEDLTALRLEQAAEAAEQGRLAAAVGTDDGGDPAGRDGQGQALDDGVGAVAEDDLVGGQPGGGVGGLGGRGGQGRAHRLTP